MTPHEAVRQLLQRYARAADDRDVVALSTLFHPDAVVTGARGAQTLDQWLDTMRGPRAFPSSMHMIGDPLITVNDTEDAATVDTYAVVYQLGDPATGGKDLTLGIRYQDEIVRLNDHWVVRRRSAQTLWMR
jgi:hypothetical protein